MVEGPGARPRLLALDFGLRTRTGHHYNFALALLEGEGAAGVELGILAGDTFHEEARFGGKVRPFFATDLYFRRRTLEASENYESWLAVNDRLLADLARIATERIAATDILLIPAVTPFHMWALCLWLRDVFLPATRARVFIQFMFSPEWSAWERACAPGPQMYLEAIDLVRAEVGRRVFLNAELIASAREYEAVLDLPVAVLPHPSLEASARQRRRTPGIAPTVGVFGYSKQEKGFHLLPAIVAGLRAGETAPRFLIHIDHGGEDPAVVEAEAALRAMAGPDLRLVHGALTAEAYQALLSEADLFLLPYDPARYRGRGSGILTEAVGLGRPVAAPSETGIGDEVATGRAAGVTFARFEAASIAAAVGEALKELTGLEARADVLAAAWAREHSGAAYLTRLRGLGA